MSAVSEKQGDPIAIKLLPMRTAARVVAGTDVMIFEIFLPKKLAFLTQNKAE
jgi:hypothetical protein